MPFVLYCKTEDAIERAGKSLKNMRISELSRLEHRLGRELLLCGLNKQYGLLMSSAELDEALSATPNGKPYLPDHPEIHFSISHSDGIVCCASLWVEFAVQVLQFQGWSAPTHSSTLLFTHMY